MSSAIISYGAYIPRHRLQRSELGAALGTGGGKGSRSVASYDEDATTLGVEAARRALRGTGNVPASIYFATTAPAYLDKTNATAIHAALDLGDEGFAVDLAGSARGAVGRAARRRGLRRPGCAGRPAHRAPGSADERDGGDAAAAFLFGDPCRGDRRDRRVGLADRRVPRPLAYPRRPRPAGSGRSASAWRPTCR